MGCQKRARKAEPKRNDEPDRRKCRPKATGHNRGAHDGHGMSGGKRIERLVQTEDRVEIENPELVEPHFHLVARPPARKYALYDVQDEACGGEACEEGKRILRNAMEPGP